MSIGWNARLERSLLVYAPPCGHADYARTATRLEGPWSDEAKLVDARGGAAYVHQLAEGGGRVEYSRPIDRGWFGAERVELARREE